MFLKNLIRSFLSDSSPILLAYHKLMAVVAAVYYGFPGRKLRVIGVTGTNGKTTVVNMIAKLLTAHGAKVGMASTVNFQLGNRTWMNTTKMSTQSAFFIQKFLREMVDNRCTYAVLEITSHALVQSRTWGIDLDVAVLTNVTGDHVEYHGGMEAYVEAKTSLFRNLIEGRKSGTSRVTILNRDDAYFSRFDALHSEMKYTYGLETGDCRAEDIRLSASGTTFELHVPQSEIGISLRLPGIPNVYNVLAVACVAVAEKIPLRVVQKVLSEIEPVAGRYELIDEGQLPHVVVDYAHNIDAMRNILGMYHGIAKEQSGRLLVVFGATGGGRDKAKRVVLGELLEQYADGIFLTDDDPYEEDEWGIIDMVRSGISRVEGDRFWIVPSRREAIRLALFSAGNDDIVVIAGKGAEPIQIVYGERRPWDDRQVARQLIREMKEVSLA